MTAIANDYGADEMFARQVPGPRPARRRLGRPLDLGPQPQPVARPGRGARVGVGTIALTGPVPNPLAELADDVLAVDAPATATVQEVHQVVVHLLCATVDVVLGVSRPAELTETA